MQFCLDVPATALATTLKARVAAKLRPRAQPLTPAPRPQMNAVYKWGFFGGANTDCGCDSLYAAYFGTFLLLSYLARGTRLRVHTRVLRSAP